MRRQEEEGSQAIPMRKVSFEGIGDLVPGVSTIEDAWIEYGGLRVSQVPVGEKFDIFCHFIARNEAGGQWKIAVTVIGDGIQNWEDETAGIPFGAKRKEMEHVELKKMGDNIMPDEDITLRLKLWLHDEIGVDPPYPPIGTW